MVEEVLHARRGTPDEVRAVVRKLIVSNFPAGTAEQEIVGWFGDYMPVSVVIKDDRYAVVTFGSEEEADRVLEGWDADDAGVDRRVRVRRAQF